MADQVFSEREGFAPQKDLQAHDCLPGWVREAITNEIREFAHKDAPLPGVDRLGLYPLFKPYIWKVLDRKPPNSPAGGPFAYYIPDVLAKCLWYQCYDILEEISSLINQRLGVEESEEFSGRINAILAREGIPWKLEEGKVVRALNQQAAEQIKEVRVLLRDPKFKGPDEQFAKAIEHLNKRPEPDEENCVKDAVGALEAIANITAGTSGKQLNDLLREEPFRSHIHQTLIQSIDKVYAYRGAAPGASHGQVGPSVVGLAEAKWVLSMSATTILYFVDKFHKPVS